MGIGGGTEGLLSAAAVGLLLNIAGQSTDSSWGEGP